MNVSEIREMNRKAIQEATGGSKDNINCILLYVVSVIVVYSLLVILQPDFVTNKETNEFLQQKAFLIAAAISLSVPAYFVLKK